MTAFLILMTYLLAFLAGAGATAMIVGVAAIRLASRAEQPRQTVQGGDGADLDVTGVMESVSERR